MNRIFNTISLFAIALLWAACGGHDKAANQNLPDPLASNIDSSVRAGADFFYYANGGWFKRNPIPSSESSNGIFRTIQDTINAQVRQICERSAAATGAAKGSNQQKIGDFFASGMDTVTIDAAGIKPLQGELGKIDVVNDIASLNAEINYLHGIGVNAGFNFFVGQDDKNSTQNAAFLWQGGLGLGEREYYFEKDSRTTQIRAEYVKHIEKMLLFAGYDKNTAAALAKDILALETQLAQVSRKLEALRDPDANYNKMPVAQLNKLAPELNWEQTMQQLLGKPVDSVIVGQPEFYTGYSALLKRFPLPVWKAYLKWNLINTYASCLSKEIEQEDFYFNATVMAGVKQQKPRWKRIVQQTDGLLGELVGQVYVEEYLPKGTKEKLLEIGNSIRDVYAERMKKLTWMSEPTRKRALDKLNRMVMKVGYPDKWKDMGALQIDRASYLQNVMEATRWQHNFMVKKYGQPVDRSEWNMFPQTYNAYYSSSNNEIVVPACNIIVPGFEGRMPDDAVLYGIIGGSTFGHEITHGFDDQGSKYDADGNLNNWWTAEDREKFTKQTKRIVDQFSAYRVLDSMHVNGDATQGENIADLGGVVMGYEAFKKTAQFKKNETVGGLTPTQRYFVSYAYAWMVNRTSENLARQVMTDVHAPAQWRVNGPVSNIPEFYEAFGVTPQDAMYRPDSLRVSIW